MNRKNIDVYEESQSFLTWWLQVLLAAMLAFVIYAGTTSDTSDTSGTSPGLWLGVVTLFGIWGLFVSVRLRTRIDSEGVHMRFAPFQTRYKTWRWDDLAVAKVVRYSPWAYGGWGFRIGRAGIAYTTKGNYGIQLVLQRGDQRILVGTQQPHAVQVVLEHYKPIDNEN